MFWHFDWEFLHSLQEITISCSKTTAISDVIKMYCTNMEFCIWQTSSFFCVAHVMKILKTVWGNVSGVLSLPQCSGPSGSFLFNTKWQISFPKLKVKNVFFPLSTIHHCRSAYRSRRRWWELPCNLMLQIDQVDCSAWLHLLKLNPVPPKCVTACAEVVNNVTCMYLLKDLSSRIFRISFVWCPRQHRFYNSQFMKIENPTFTQW